MTTTTYAFGAGTVYAALSGKPPVKVGALQNIEIDISGDIKTLYGAGQYPLAIARGQSKIEGKASSGQFDFNLFNNLFQQGTPDATGYLRVVDQTEAQSIPDESPYTVQATNHSGFDTDLGIYYADGSGQLTPVASGSEAAGKYSVNAATGTYTFAAADAGKQVLLAYIYKANTGQQLTITNQPMGIQPVFQLILQESFEDFGATKYMSLKLNRCVSSKMTFPFKNSDFLNSEFDFQAFADSLGNVGIVGVGT
jgi:hypothetical protein